MDGQAHNIDLTQQLFIPAIGSQVLKYKILGRLGEGGMGEVYLAKDLDLQRNVALKFLHQQLCNDQVHYAKFIREAQKAARIDHPNIVHIYEVAEYARRPFFAMQFIEGQNLAEYMAGRKLRIEQVLEMGIAISDALAAAHEHGIVHRDLKPANIMIDKSGRINILDFGLAAFDDSGSSANFDKTMAKLETSGLLQGTIPYMAPEQIDGHPISHSVDIFALGVILYELTCGARPFPGPTSMAIISSILRDNPPQIDSKRPDTPYDLNRIIMRCLQKDPGRRFQIARDVKNELEDVKTAAEPKPSQFIDHLNAGGLQDKLTELSFPITTELVRRLEGRSVRMIGDKLTYVENNIDSETMVILLHGMGMDQRFFADVLQKLPCRGIAPTIYGFGADSLFRPALSLNDHSILLRSLFGHLKQLHKPRHVILVGFSSGADHALQLISTHNDAGIDIDGLLLLGCNINRSTCHVSVIFSRFEAGNQAEMLSSVKGMGDGAATLNEWFLRHDYLVQVLRKFGNDLSGLRKYAADIASPFPDDDPGQFISWYRTAIENVGSLRFVFAREEFPALDMVLMKHLEDGVLGERYSEKTIVREDIPHIELKKPGLIIRHIDDIIKEL